MRSTVILLTALIVSTALMISCSSPCPDATKYVVKQQTNTNKASGTNEIVDITQQTASAIPATPTIKQAEAKPEETLKKTVAPGNLPKCVDQFAATKKVWEKMKEAKEYYGDSEYIYDLGDQGYINGNPLEQMGGKPTPVPLFQTWDTAKLDDLKDVRSFISHGAIVKIVSRRRTPEGNWYMVKIMNSGFEHIKGWVPEQLVSKTQAVTSGGFRAGACSTGG